MSEPNKIDRYEVLGVLGQGSYGVVYLAHDPKLDREVAIKVLNPELLEDDDAKALFHREARAIAKLRHPSILELFDYSGPESAAPYLIVERLEGENLEQFLERRGEPLDGFAAAAAGHEICLALQHAHDRGIVHRDIKPENVFIEPGGRIVLCDFGIARSFDPKAHGTLAARGTAVLGSPLFMSPEQISTPQSIGPASDLFAVGSLLYFLVSGKHAFEDPNIVRIFEKILLAEAVPLRQVRAGLPERMYAIIERAHQVRPEARFPSARAFADELVALIREGGELDPRTALEKALSQLAVESGGHEKSQVIPLASLKASEKTRIATLSQIRSPVADTMSATQVATRASVTATSRVSSRRLVVVPATALALLAVVMLYAVRARSPSTEIARTQAAVNEPASPMHVPVLPQPASEPQIDVPPVADATTPESSLAQMNRPSTAAKPRVVVPAGAGSLDLIASPWADVYIDGRKVGTTPMFRSTSLPSGKHRLKLVHPQSRVIERTVVIRSGEITELAVEMEIRP